MNGSHRSMGTVAATVQLMGLDVVRQHGEMVFVSHNFSFLKFTEDAGGLYLFYRNHQRYRAIGSDIEMQIHPGIRSPPV